MSQNKQNLVLILFDSLRYSSVQTYGYHRKTMPNLEQIGQQGVRFENTFVQAPFTVSSAASIMTGVYPSVHGIQHYGERFSDDLFTLPEILKKAGYRSVAFIANPHVNAESGILRGFDEFTDGRSGLKRARWFQPFTKFGESGGVINQTIEKDLKAHQDDDRPFFYLIFYIDTHVPFSELPRILLPFTNKKYHSPNFGEQPYSEEEVQRVVDLYDQAIGRADRYFGELWQLFKQHNHLADTTFIVSADHGEGLDNRSERGGHGRLYENGIRVPFYVFSSQMAANERGKTVHDMITSLDIAPTFCDAAKIPAPEQFQGQSLMPYLRGEPPAFVREHVFSEYHNGRSVRGKQWKLIQMGSGIAQPYSASLIDHTELYDLTETPLEEHNLAEERKDIVAQYATLLREFVEDCERQSREIATFNQDETVVERLRGLGYIE